MRKETQDAQRAAALPDVNGIVGAGEQLVQVPGVELSTLVLPQNGKIGRDLTV